MIIDKDILRWVLLFGATPLWLPFLRALWRDFNHALRADGGLIGSPPGPVELERMQREKSEYPDPLRSEPRIQPGERRTTRMRAPRNEPGPSARPAPRRPGFKNKGR
jgi:hypothetical protein